MQALWRHSHLAPYIQHQRHDGAAGLQAPLREPPSAHLHQRVHVQERQLVIQKPQQCKAYSTEVQPQADALAATSDEGAQQNERRTSHAHASTSSSFSRDEQQSSATQRVRPIYIWPKLRNIMDRPAFLDSYPPKLDGPGGFNINSFLGKLEPHAGKFYVPPEKYRDFLTQYTEAVFAGHLMFLTEVYGGQPFRYFIELDFEWDTPEDLVLQALPPVLDIIQRTVKEHYQVEGEEEGPSYVISMRTCYKVHLNFPAVLTTELLSHMCREKIIERCKSELPQELQSSSSPLLDWERIIDFPHGSFRLIGSRKTRKMDKDPTWVLDKAYYPVKLSPDGSWAPRRITEDLIRASSIIPTRKQLRDFERSPAYANMIFEDMVAAQARMQEKLARRLEAKLDPEAPPSTKYLVRAETSSSTDGSSTSGTGPGAVQLGSSGTAGAPSTTGSTRTEDPPLVKVVLKPTFEGGLSLYLKVSKLAEQQKAESVAAGLREFAEGPQGGEVGKQYLAALQKVTELRAQLKALQPQAALLYRRLQVIDLLGIEPMRLTLDSSGSGSSGDSTSDPSQGAAVAQQQLQQEQEVAGSDSAASSVDGNTGSRSAGSTGSPADRVGQTGSEAPAPLAANREKLAVEYESMTRQVKVVQQQYSFQERLLGSLRTKLMALRSGNTTQQQQKSALAGVVQQRQEQGQEQGAGRQQEQAQGEQQGQGAPRTASWQQRRQQRQQQRQQQQQPKHAHGPHSEQGQLQQLGTQGSVQGKRLPRKQQQQPKQQELGQEQESAKQTQADAGQQQQQSPAAGRSQQQSDGTDPQPTQTSSPDTNEEAQVTKRKQRAMLLKPPPMLLVPAGGSLPPPPAPPKQYLAQRPVLPPASPDAETSNGVVPASGPSSASPIGTSSSALNSRGAAAGTTPSQTAGLQNGGVQQPNGAATGQGQGGATPVPALQQAVQARGRGGAPPPPPPPLNQQQQQQQQHGGNWQHDQQQQHQGNNWQQQGQQQQVIGSTRQQEGGGGQAQVQPQPQGAPGQQPPVRIWRY